VTRQGRWLSYLAPHRYARLVSIERIFYCDWRECEKNGSGSEFHTVSQMRHGGQLHFCSWDCLLKHAGEQPPVIVIPFAAAGVAED
jgi:hypothetical protein